MPAPLAVDKEAVRVLVVDVGVREAARIMNLNENTVLAWSNRGGWLDHLKPENQPKPPASMQPVVAIGAIKPADALANTLADRLKRSKLGMSAWLTESSEHLGTLKGEEALAAHQAAVSAASVMTKLYPETNGEDRVGLQFFAIQVNVAGGEREDGPVIDCGEIT